MSETLSVLQPTRLYYILNFHGSTHGLIPSLPDPLSPPHLLPQAPLFFLSSDPSLAIPLHLTLLNCPFLTPGGTTVLTPGYASLIDPLTSHA